MKAYVSYIRVSTKRQGQSGLGLEAQQEAVKSFLHGSGGHLLAEFREVETGAEDERPQLGQALALARKARATLLIAKLDRLSRSAPFLLSLRDSDTEFTCCDMPTADRFTIGIFALLAEKEREMISERVRAALAAAKRRGTKLGNPSPLGALNLAWRARKQACHAFAASMAPILAELRSTGLTRAEDLAQALNRRGYSTSMKRPWSKHTVANLIKAIAS